MVATCIQVSAVRPAVQAQTRSARSVRAPVRCSAQKDGRNYIEASKVAALAAAASLLLAQPSFAGEIFPQLPDSAPAPPKEKFERDLGEGRKLKMDPKSSQNSATRTTAGRRGGPSDSADARDEPDMKVSGGGQAGISKALPKSSTSAPIS